ncbi:MAG: ABC transporter substrate-binding protein [Defluviitaleaceae bacterium]|nr:ABC transporter substrate-binding protein [Defluviitaleaceae bacterium]MCL2262438.1 ABC transporter substrate-binding protein [Defluviitaleaceae bacterium]
MKKFFVLMLAFAIALSFSGCFGASDDGRPVIRIGYLPITHAMPLFTVSDMVADYSDFAVALERFSSWPDLMDALNGGHIDGASVLIQLAMVSKEAGVDLRAVALGHRDGNIVVVADYIETVQDLRGKTIAIPSPMSTHSMLLNMLLAENDMSQDDVDVIQLAPTEMVSALASGSISAYVVAEPFGARAVTLDVGVKFAESHDIWEDSLCCALVFSYDFIRENEDIVSKFMHMYHEAGAFLERNINPITYRVREIASRYLMVDDETLELSLKWISFADLNINEAEYDKLYNLMIDMGLSQSPPRFNNFVINHCCIGGQ